MKARILHTILGEYSSMANRAPTFSEYFFEAIMEDKAFRRHTDVKIILTMDPNKEEFNLHKVILASNSTFFRKMFYNDPKNVYEIGAVNKEDFDLALGCMYGKQTPCRMTDTLLETLHYLGCDKIAARITEAIQKLARLAAIRMEEMSMDDSDDNDGMDAEN